MRKLTKKEIARLAPGDPVTTNMGKGVYEGYCRTSYAHKVKLDTGENKNVWSLFAEK